MGDLTPPLRDMFLTTDTDITPTEPTVTTTERGPLMLRLRLRLIPRLSMATTGTLTVWDTTWAMLVTATLATPSLMVGSLPPMLPLATPLPTQPEVSPTPAMSVSAPTTLEPSSPARQKWQHSVLLNLLNS